MDRSALKPGTMPHFSIVELDQGRLCEALPLVRMAVPEIDGPRWTNYCENLRRLNGGVMVAIASDDGMHGLAIYRPVEDLRLGRIVCVDAMVTFELNPANPVRKALCEAVEKLCDTMEARGIMLMIAERVSGDQGSCKARGWESAGFRQHGAALWKPQRHERRIVSNEAG